MPSRARICLDHLEAVETGQVQIEQQHVEAPSSMRPSTFVATTDHDRIVPSARDLLEKELGAEFVVLRNEDAQPPGLRGAGVGKHGLTIARPGRHRVGLRGRYGVEHVHGSRRRSTLPLHGPRQQRRTGSERVPRGYGGAEHAPLG